MPVVISSRMDAPFTEFVLEFRVFADEKGDILGFVMPWLGDYGGTAEQAAAQLGQPVKQAFAAALVECAQQGLRYVWVNDPGNLFPPDNTPGPSLPG